MRKQSLKLPTIDVTGSAKDPTGILASVALKASDIEPTDQIYREFENTSKRLVNYRLQARRAEEYGGKNGGKSYLPNISRGTKCGVGRDKNAASLPTLKELSSRVRNVCQDASSSYPDVGLSALSERFGAAPTYPGYDPDTKTWDDSKLRSIVHYVKDEEGNLVPCQSSSVDDEESGAQGKEFAFGSHKLCACRTHQNRLTRAHLSTPTPITSSSAQDFGLLRRDGACFFRPDYTSLTPRCDYDSDADYDLKYSLTLPRIEAVLKSEGIKPHSISQQIEKIRDRCKRQYSYKPPGRGKRNRSQENGDTDVGSSRELVLLNAQQELDGFLSDIQYTRWLSLQQLEQGIVGDKFVPPRVVLVSSNIPRCQMLLRDVIKKDDDVITISYDFENSSFDDVIGEMRGRLEGFQPGSKIRSILLFCKGGPGHLYLFKRKVVTPQKLKKKEQTELIKFWQDIGELMSKSNPEESFFHIAGCDVVGQQEGYQLFKAIRKVMQPNVLHFAPLDPTTEKGRSAIELYLHLPDFMRWTRLAYINSPSHLSFYQTQREPLNGSDVIQGGEEVEDIPADMDYIMTVQEHNTVSTVMKE